MKKTKMMIYLVALNTVTAFIVVSVVAFNTVTAFIVVNVALNTVYFQSFLSILTHVSFCNSTVRYKSQLSRSQISVDKT